MSTLGVEVPEVFRRVGYSGLFHLETTVSGTPEERQALADRCPVLSPTPGWMVMSADVERGIAVVVRRDANAFMEAFTRPRSKS